MQQKTKPTINQPLQVTGCQIGVAPHTLAEEQNRKEIATAVAQGKIKSNQPTFTSNWIPDVQTLTPSTRTKNEKQHLTTMAALHTKTEQSTYLCKGPARCQMSGCLPKFHPAPLHKKEKRKTISHCASTAKIRTLNLSNNWMPDIWMSPGQKNERERKTRKNKNNQPTFVSDQIPDVQNLHLSTRINEKEKQLFSNCGSFLKTTFTTGYQMSRQLPRLHPAPWHKKKGEKTISHCGSKEEKQNNIQSTNASTASSFLVSPYCQQCCLLLL